MSESESDDELGMREKRLATATRVAKNASRYSQGVAKADQVNASADLAAYKMKKNEGTRPVAPTHRTAGRRRRRKTRRRHTRRRR
jgi:hypothetical protein